MMKRRTSKRPPDGWPVLLWQEPIVDWSKAAEILLHITLTLVAILPLAFASLAAFVHNTYPGWLERYTPGGPVFISRTGNLFVTNKGKVINRSTEGMAPAPSDLNYFLLEIAQLAPTFLPILFSAILGNTLRLLGRWRVENGCKIITVEVLYGSRGFSSTIWMLFTLRASILLNLGLTILWATSPLAGQASLRILYQQNITTESADVPWSVMNTHNSGSWANKTIITKYSHSLSTNYISAMQYGGALNWDDHNNAFDSNSFPLLPSAEPFTGGNQGSEQPETNFSALQGIVIYGPRFSSQLIRLSAFRTESNITFPVSLFKFECSAVEQHSITDSLAARKISNETETGPSFVAKNGFFLQFNETKSGSDNSTSRIIFGSFYNESHVTTWTCDISLSTRLLAMKCHDWQLPLMSTEFQPGVTDPDAPRPWDGHSVMCTLLNASSSTATNFGGLRKALSVIFSTWPRLDRATASVPSVTETYLATGKAWKEKPRTSKSYDLAKLDKKSFENRLTTAFNTLWLTSQQSVQVGTPWADYANLASSATPLFFTPFDVIKCNWVFFAILVATSLILLACSALNIWLRIQITTPDVLGYVSSSTIDNPYFQLPEALYGSGSMLDGHKRTSLLKDTRVILGDVQHDQEVGKLALSCEGEWVRKFDNERLYV